jgi:hypothetical protein
MKALYLEPDEEITSVVDRLKEIDDDEVAIVVPKRAGLLQSIVNLKLLRYQAEQQKKRISLVTTDKTGRNLASAVGLTVYQKLPEGKVKGKKNLPTESAIKEPAEEIPIKFRRKPPKDAAKPGDPDADDINYKKGAKPEIVTKEVAGEERIDITQDDDGQPVGVEDTKIQVESESAAFEDVKQVADEADITDIEPEAEVAAAEPTEAEAPKQSKRKSAKAVLSSVKVPKVKLPKVNASKKVKDVREKAAAAKPKTKLPWKIIAAVVLVLLLAGGTAAAVVLPKATITVTPKSTPVTADVPMTFSASAPSVDTEANVVPAKPIEVTKTVSRQVTATGRNEGGEKASGDIVVVNDLPRNQSLVARTRFQSPDGRVFRAQSSVVVPAGGQTTVRVVADEGGEAGNLAAGTKLTIPGLKSTDAVTAKVDTALTGGTNSASTTITEADVDRAKNELAAQAAQEGVADAKSKLAVGYKIDPKVASTTVLNSSANPDAGSTATKFTESGTVKVVYFTYQQQDFDKVLDPDLKAKVPAGSELTDQQTETFAVKQSSDNQLSGTMKIETAAVTDISKEEIKDQISGKSPEQAKAALRKDDQITDVTIKLFPFWVTSVPGSSKKIIIDFKSGSSPTLPTPSPTASSTASAVPQI